MPRKRKYENTMTIVILSDEPIIPDDRDVLYKMEYWLDSGRWSVKKFKVKTKKT